MTSTIYPPTWTSSVTHLRTALKLLSATGQSERYLSREKPKAVLRLERDFATFAHGHQEHCDQGAAGPWTTWLILGGRGAGKTRAGAEWVKDVARQKGTRIALVGESEHDAREVMIEGVSGILAVHQRVSLLLRALATAHLILHGPLPVR